MCVRVDDMRVCVWMTCVCVRVDDMRVCACG